jgi:hypothetical protein
LPLDKEDQVGDKISTEGQSGGVNISGDSAKVGGDIVGRDSIRAGGDIVGRDKLTIGDSAAQSLAQWRALVESKIEAQPNLSAEDKKDLKDQVAKIQAEASKGAQADPSRLEKLINTLAVMAPDIFEVAVTTIANPLAGIGLALKKIGDKAKLERATKAA